MTHTPEEKEKADKAIKEMRLKLKEMLKNSEMGLMINPLVGKLVLEDEAFKSQDPELYYELKSRFREYLKTLEGAVLDVQKILNLPESVAVLPPDSEEPKKEVANG